MSDVLETLQEWENAPNIRMEIRAMAKAARAEIERLRAALKPFAAYATAMDAAIDPIECPDDMVMSLARSMDSASPRITYGDLRRAAKALASDNRADAAPSK